MTARPFAALLVLALAGCANLAAVVASPHDLEDYRAFRVAAAEGTRLARAKRYLERHPDGAWASEVRAAFEREEPVFFEKAQRSRRALLGYLADLPDGPHAEAALALLQAFGSSMEDAELRDIARRVRLGDEKLEAAAAQRRAVSSAIVSAVDALLDERAYGAPLAEAPPELRRLLAGGAPPTWGALPSRAERDYFFSLPTRPLRESRVVSLEVSLEVEGGAIVGGRIEAEDLLVRWAEAEQIVRLDPTLPEDRTEAHVFAMGRLEGALERRFPAATCEDRRTELELFRRACGGWEAAVVPGTGAGEKDVIVVRAPRARTTEPRSAPTEAPDRTDDPLHLRP